jgi:hypothetical protein
MCSCNSSKKGGTATATRVFTHTYTDESGKTVTKPYSSEMDARMQAARLGGTVK